MKLPFVLGNGGPGLRAGVLCMAAGLVVLAAFLVSTNVSDHVAATATNEAIRSAAAVVRADVDPLVTRDVMTGPTADQAEAINAQLGRLVASRQILRLKIWSPNGTVLFSDLPVLRGQQFSVEGDLREALAGQPSAEYSDGTDPENVFERGLAAEFLSIYLPIAAPDGTVVGVYEIYEDAGPIEAQIVATRADVLGIVGIMAITLLILLWVAFSAASRLLARQNRQLREKATTEQFLVTDLRRSEERFRSLVQNATDVIMVMRADGTIAYESPAVERVLGYRVADRLDHQALGFIHPDDIEAVRQLVADVARVPGAQLSGEFRTRHAIGSWRSIEVVAKNLIGDAAVRGIVINYRDITDRRALERELEHRAFHDSLTGLANRALFADRLSHALLRRPRSRHPLAVLFLDLDDFKTVNDSMGHNEGDQLLVAVADRLRNALRASDTIARMGGDEFAILVEDPPDALVPVEVAKRLLDALDPPFNLHSTELYVRASVGIAISKSTSQTAEELLRNADVSMYTAKRAGKNRVEVFEPSMHSAVLARLALKVDLERALQRHEFTIQYQPIFDLGSRTISGAEALVRWQHPERGQVEPLDFIPVAEETGLIVPLGAWVLEQACAQAVLWNRDGGAGPVTMSVNVSGRQVQSDGFVEEVGRVLAATGLEPRLLLLEFTESVLMQDTASTGTTLAGLKKLGVRLGIDDFGTGYSSLSYLRQFPIDVLKIDRSFVAASGGGPEQAAVVRSIVQLGETLHLETIAEGIEEAGQLANVRTLGANLGQGFFLARPLNAAAVSALLEAGVQGLDPVSAAVSGIGGLVVVAGPYPSDPLVDPRRLG